MTVDLSSDAAQKYDDVRYTSIAFDFTHPARLGAIGRLHGVCPTRLSVGGRVLEIGCATGGNLIPLAAGFPNAEFVGIDISPRQIDDGRRRASFADVKNVTFRCADIAERGATSGRFDYIICHGVYSWVDDLRRDHILRLIRDHLAENGVAMVSYNTFPGWYLYSGLRDLALTAASASHAPDDQVSLTRAAFSGLRDALVDSSPMSAFLKESVATALGHADDYLFHEYLARDNTPVYFQSFANSLASHALDWLGESPYSHCPPKSMAPSAATIIEAIEDRVGRQHMLDHFMQRSFRQTVVCHQSTPHSANWSKAAIGETFVAERFVHVERAKALLSSEPTKVWSVGNLCSQALFPITKAAVELLHARSAGGISFHSLLTGCREHLSNSGGNPNSSDDRLLASFLSSLFEADAIEYLLEPIALASAPLHKPQLWRWCRSEIEAGATYISGLAHRATKLSADDARLLLLCDGTRTQSEVIDAYRSISNGEQSSPAASTPAENHAYERMEKYSRLGCLVRDSV